MRVYSCCGCFSSCSVGPISTSSPCLSTATRSAISATTPKSWVMNSTPVPALVCSSLMSLSVCACVVTSSAVVGSSAMSSTGSRISAIAIMMRWRCPPDSWCGNESYMRAGSGRCTCSIIARMRALRSAGASCVCSASTSSICTPQRMTGFSAVIGSWKIMPMRVQRNSRSRASDTFTKSSPCRAMRLPVRTGRLFGSRPMVEKAMTDLPEPDSPTRQTISPGATDSVTPVTALSRSLPLGRPMLRFLSSRTGLDRVVIECGSTELR